MVPKYTLAALLGLAGGALIGYLIGAVVGLTAMNLIQYQDTPPDYAYIPFLVGIVAGPIWNVARVRAKGRRQRGEAPHTPGP